MFKEFFTFELKYWMKSPVVYIFLLINFLMVFAASMSEQVMVGKNMGNANVNSPFALMSYAAFISLISIVMTTTFVNQAALKDFTNNFHSILFSTPMKRASYLLGRFTSSVLVACVPLLGVLLAVFVVPYFYPEQDKVGPQYTMAFVDTFLTFLLPNTLLISAIIFALAVKFRSTTISFIGAIFLLIGYLFATSFITNHDHGYVATLADPFGVNSISEITKYWTLSEKNSQWLGFTGPMLANRLLWLGIAVAIFGFSYYSFSFSEKKSKKQQKGAMKAPLLTSQFKTLSKLPSVAQIHGIKSQMIQFYSQFKSEFLGIIKSPAFLIILLFALVNLMGSTMASDHKYGSGNLLVTYVVLESIEGSLHLFIYVIIAYYTGAMVWRERNAQFNEIIDASPVPSWIPLASKYLSMLAVVASISFCAMLIGMSIQASKGYYNLEPLLYLKQLFLIDLSRFAILIAVSLFIQVGVNSMYLGFFVFILFLIVNNFLWGALEVDSNLLKVGSVPSFRYSDMHQYALGASGIIWYKSYWLLFSGLLLITSALFWVRGKALTLKNRWAIAKQRFDRPMAVPFYSVLSLWILVGGFLFYNANILNSPMKDSEKTQMDMTYERLYKQYEHINQPRIVALDHAIDLYPHTRKLKAKTEVIIKNKHDQAIDSIHFSTAYDYQTAFDLPNSTLVYEDEKHHYFIYQLDNALLPGDSLTFYVHSSYEAKGIENEVAMKWINENGSFIHSYSFMPTIGYDPGREYQKPTAREKFGLEPIERYPALDATCSANCHNNYISSDSDWIRLSSTISTSADQMAIAPGALTKEWSVDGRNYYRYELDKPVINFYAFLSAKYEVKREKWEGVDLEVYYHKGHEYNVDKMMRAMRTSLTYYSENFSPYPHQQARIIEFPRYSSFAQAFPGTMPYSESMGYIANLKDENDVDKVFHTVAHEMAHQWWAHQVIGARMQGATMLSESFAQYSALVALEAAYGEDLAQKYLKYEMDDYLRSRGGERIAELPLMQVENQDYIHYAKGSLAMNAIKAYIGADRLNSVLQRFIDQTAYQEPPYTTSSVFIAELEKVVPDSFQYLVDDLFKDIILYNNQAVSGTYRPLDNGQYELTLTVEVEKYRADKKGKEELLDLDDYLYVGVYGKDSGNQPLYYQLHKFTQKQNTIKLILDEEPYKAGVDPKHLLIDRVREDNVIGVELVE